MAEHDRKPHSCPEPELSTRMNFRVRANEAVLHLGVNIIEYIIRSHQKNSYAQYCR
ncbi:hypothetical protein SAMN06295960_2120 [Paenibacillus aquistagni]|uniref:Uncharacterized protein n=1 Tax=Paenibacillus aquistagni TaxID=1852522 RepID=A0A1X7K6S3_9BACL|nr:hypothetical protein SAMN06295960_2120 [Paenibacillus aquistagni]